MIPDFVFIAGAPWEVLPPGIHIASLHEIQSVFAINPHRRNLFAGILAAAQNLANAGCAKLYLDGSYITKKEMPGDFDGCWDVQNVNFEMIDPVLLDFNNGRQAQKLKYKGELFPNVTENSCGQLFSEFFQHEKNSGGKKGILEIDIKNDLMIRGV